MLLEHGGRAAWFDPLSLWFGPAVEDEAEVETAVADARAVMAAVRARTDAPSATAIAADRAQLERLVINIANVCNLNCAYCYAQGGDYGGPRRRMTFGTGRQALARALREYGEVATVQFFGGEPLLARSVATELAAFGWDEADRLGVPRPTYMLSTNGTVLDDAVIAFVRDFDVRVTVSLDGPPEINDVLRPSRTGQPTTAQVLDNIVRLRSATGQPSQIEGTMTSLHVRHDWSVTAVLDWLHTMTGIDLVHFPVNVLDPDGPHDRQDPHGVGHDDAHVVQRWYADAVARTVRLLAREPLGRYAHLATAVDLVDDLVRPRAHTQPLLCPAGSGTIAVDVDGAVLPCFMFYGRREFHVGSVRDRAPFVDGERQRAFVERLDKARAPRSWARRFAAGCAGGSFFQRGDHGAVTEDDLRLVEAMVSAAVVELANLQPAELAFVPSAIDLFRAYVRAPSLA